MGRPMLHATCTIRDCRRPHVARGMCRPHWAQWIARNRDLTQPLVRGSHMERLVAHTVADGTHLIWQRSYRSGGRVSKDIPQVARSVHPRLNFRVALWEELMGAPVSDGFTVRSLPGCPRGCVAPDHLRIAPIHGDRLIA